MGVNKAFRVIDTNGAVSGRVGNHSTLWQLNADGEYTSFSCGEGWKDQAPSVIDKETLIKELNEADYLVEVS